MEPKEKEKQNEPKKWHMCQAFGEINRDTEIAPVPQGDIRAKTTSFRPPLFTYLQFCSRVLQGGNVRATAESDLADF